MSVLIQIFLMFCIMAPPQFCGKPVQPLSSKGNMPKESEIVGRQPTIYSLINDTKKSNHCAVSAELKYPLLKEYCERPVPAKPDEKAYFNYDAALCMVLYDVTDRVCKGGHREIIKGSQSFSNFSCDTMIKRLPETSFKETEPWVTAIKAKFENVSNCERACLQGSTVSPLCEYILRAQEAQVSTISQDTSHAENLERQVNSQDHRKANKTVADKDKTSEKKSESSSAVSSTLSMQNDVIQKKPHTTNKTKVTNTSVVDKDVTEANGKHPHSDSENHVHSNAKEESYALNTNMQSGTKNQTHTNTMVNNGTKQTNAGNDTRNTNSSVQNNVDKKGNAISSNSQATEVTPHNAAISQSEYTEHTSEAEKYDDNKGKDISVGSKSNTTLQTKNKSSAGANGLHPEVNNGNSNENSVTTTETNYIKEQDTGVADAANDEEQDEGEINLESPGEQIPKETEKHQEEAETGNIAQFNQIGDVDDSHFYAYFMTMVVICIIGYLLFHNKQKILALALEGRSHRGTRRRPSTSAYRKLDSNLEEAVTSTRSTSVTHVIY